MYGKLAMILLFCTLTKQYKASRKEDSFTCVGKVIGGYYADVQSGCQMFHVCTLDGNVELQDIVFKCIIGTVFDQETRVCERQEEVNCAISEDFYYLNNELYGPGIIPDTAIDNSFKTTGQVMTLNGSIKRPNDFQSYMINSKSDFVRVSRPTSSWSYKIPIKNKSSSLSCDYKSRSGFYADTELGCRVFHLCIEFQSGRFRKKESYACSENDPWFDESVGKCVASFPSTCEKFSINKSSAALRIKGTFENGILDLCRNVGHNGLIPDINSNCNQYFSCKVTSGDLYVEIYKCKYGMSFSTKYQKCIEKNKSKCNVKPSHQFDIGISKEKINLRFRRNSLLENHHNRRETSGGFLGSSDGILSDHASVIDNDSPGNIVIEGSSMQNTDKTDKDEEVFPTILTPKTLHAKNQTLRNGTVVEVNEISSDQNGKVTITSIVPKFVRLNGNKLRKKFTESPPIATGISVSSFQSKVIFSGANSTTPDNIQEKINEMTNLSHIFGNDSISFNETTDESDSANVSDTDTAPVTTRKTTKLIVDSTTISVNTEDTSSTTKESIAETDLSTNDIIETNFTCKDKELEQFYPDVEAECKVFHYCATGFSDDQVLDLKFLCTGDTRFNSVTAKCQNMKDVICETATTFNGITTPIINIESTTPIIEKSISTTSFSTIKDPLVSSKLILTTAMTSSIPFATTIAAITDTSSTHDDIENVNNSSVAKSLTTDTDNEQLYNVSTPSSEFYFKANGSSTTPNTIITSLITLNMSADESKLQDSKKELTVEETNQSITPSTLTTENILVDAEETALLENISTSTEKTINEIMNDNFTNSNASVIAEGFEDIEEATSLQLETERNVTVSENILLQSSTLIDESTVEFVPQNGKVSSENSSADISITRINTSTPILNKDIVEDTAERPLSGLEVIDIVTENNFSADNLTTISPDK